MDKIEIYLIKIKTIRLLKLRVNELVDSCLLHIRVFYELLADFIFMEEYLWEAC